jgi:hypothetical protein
VLIGKLVQRCLGTQCSLINRFTPLFFDASCTGLPYVLTHSNSYHCFTFEQLPGYRFDAFRWSIACPTFQT